MIRNEENAKILVIVVISIVWLQAIWIWKLKFMTFGVKDKSRNCA